MKILIATDAWYPQVNGVVRTLSHLREELLDENHEVFILGPDHFLSFPCPTYHEIKLAWGLWDVGPRIERFRPDAIHIATEGPIGLATRAWSVLKRFPFTTSFTTRFPEYCHARFRIPLHLSYAYFRWFHAPSSCLMVSTPSLEREFRERGFERLGRWSRGVDTEEFKPLPRRKAPLNKPVFLYVGRVAIEKNLPAFLELDLPGSKVVVGDGPARQELAELYPDVKFAGVLKGRDLVQAYSDADVFVFPSLTDTFGIVMLEAMACGLPVAAFPVVGPRDVIESGKTGFLSQDLRAAALACRDLSRETCRKTALKQGWRNSAHQFLDNLHPRIGTDRHRRAV